VSCVCVAVSYVCIAVSYVRVAVSCVRVAVSYVCVAVSCVCVAVSYVCVAVSYVRVAVSYVRATHVRPLAAGVSLQHTCLKNKLAVCSVRVCATDVEELAANLLQCACCNVYCRCLWQF